MLLLALCFAEAGSRFDEPGGGYVYTREAFGPFVGFQVGWMTWLARVASAAALWNGYAQALTFFWPGATAGAARVAVITLPLALNLWINIVGVKYGARLGVGLTIAKTLPLLFLIVVGIPALNGSLIFPMHAPGAAGFSEAATLLVFAYGGFENTAAAAGERSASSRPISGSRSPIAASRASASCSPVGSTTARSPRSTRSSARRRSRLRPAR